MTKEVALSVLNLYHSLAPIAEMSEPINQVHRGQYASDQYGSDQYHYQVALNKGYAKAAKMNAELVNSKIELVKLAIKTLKENK